MSSPDTPTQQRWREYAELAVALIEWNAQQRQTRLAYAETSCRDCGQQTGRGPSIPYCADCGGWQ